MGAAFTETTMEQAPKCLNHAGMVEPEDSFSDRLAAARERSGMSLEALAREAGVTLQTMWRYEKGERKPNVDVVASIAHALGCDVAWLVSGEAVADMDNAPIPAALREFLGTRLGQTATDEELATLWDLTPYNGRATPDTYAHMLTVLRTTVEPDPEAEARFQASGYMRSSLDRFKKK